ncbi:7549_t:CDS:1, partial [Cetraspora pellucida]
INTDPVDLIGSSMENIVVNNSDSDEQDQDDTQEGSSFRPDWMILSDMVP